MIKGLLIREYEKGVIYAKGLVNVLLNDVRRGKRKTYKPFSFFVRYVCIGLEEKRKKS